MAHKERGFRDVCPFAKKASFECIWSAKAHLRCRGHDLNELEVQKHI